MTEQNKNIEKQCDIHVVIKRLIEKDETNAKEILHYFYHIGGRDTLTSSSLGKGEINFENRLEEFKQNNVL